jgi:hypothetical protein
MQGKTEKGVKLASNEEEIVMELDTEKIRLNQITQFIIQII